MNVSLRLRARVVAAGVLLACVVPGGCVTETKTEQGGVVKVDAKKARRPAPESKQASRQTRRPSDPNAAPHSNEAADPCAMRLHDLSGLLLMYYAVNKRLPESLDDLRPLADLDTEFSTACPASGRPYVYVPAAMPPPGSDQFLVLYDAVPAHQGLRWGVFIAPPRDRQPPTTKVILMSEVVFRNYVPRGS